MRRIKSTQHWFLRYLKQHLYVPVLYGLVRERLSPDPVLLTGCAALDQDTHPRRHCDVPPQAQWFGIILAKGCAECMHVTGSVRVNPPTALDLAIFIGGKARAHSNCHLVTQRTSGILSLLPLYSAHRSWRVPVKSGLLCERRLLHLFSCSWQLGLFFVSDLVSSYYLALAFQCSHVVSEVILSLETVASILMCVFRQVQWPLPDKNHIVNIDWSDMYMLLC